MYPDLHVGLVVARSPRNVLDRVTDEQMVSCVELVSWASANPQYAPGVSPPDVTGKKLQPSVVLLRVFIKPRMGKYQKKIGANLNCGLGRRALQRQWFLELVPGCKMSTRTF